MAGEKVLLLDNGADSLDFLLEQVLIPQGYQLLMAKDTEECLHKGLWENPDLIVLTSQFLSPSILATHETIHSRLPKIPVIIVASYGPGELAEEALRQGVKECILKPFTAEGVKRAIDTAMGKAPPEEPAARKRSPQASPTHAVGRSIVSTLDTEKVLGRTVEAAVYLTAADEGSLLLLEGDELYLRAARSQGERYAHTLRKRVENNLITQLLQEGNPKMERGPRGYEWGEVETGHLVAHILSVPLHAQDELIGLLSVSNQDPDRPFQESHLSSLVSLAQYASIAITNAHLFEELLRAYEEAQRPPAREQPPTPPWGIERRKGERRVAERRQGERRVAERRQKEKRQGEKRQGKRRQGESEGLELRCGERRQKERREEARRKGERRQEERRKGDRRQAERRQGERRADLPWAKASETSPSTLSAAPQREERSVEGVVPYSLPTEERRSEMAEKLVGRVTHYYGHIGVAVIEVIGAIKVGDTIHIKGGTRDFQQGVDSMEIEHQKVEVAKRGESIGLKVIEKVREGDEVFRVE